MKTYIYVDGFNLYYGCLKRTPFKWLDISKLCALMLPGHDILAIKYFTAHVKPRKNNPDQHIRQNMYLRALSTVPNTEVIEGHFLSNTVKMALATNDGATWLDKLVRKCSLPFWRPCVDWSEENGKVMVKVIKTSEKGSDVNLATHLLHDAYQNKFDVAALITGDSDLVLPVKIVSMEINKQVGVINPQPHPCQDLKKVADFYKQIRPSVLEKCQFPDQLTDIHGIFHKPARW